MFSQPQKISANTDEAAKAGSSGKEKENPVVVKEKAPTKVEEKVPEQQVKHREERRDREEAELVAATLQERTSRSGRIRKPSRLVF